MKYKIGDKVRIVSEKSEPGWNKAGEMDKWLGQIMTIKDINTILFAHVYLMEEDNQTFMWGDYMIAGSAFPSINITTDGKTTTATLTDTDGKTRTATAKCSPEDKFDFMVGAKLAVERLQEQMKFVPHLTCYGDARGNIGDKTTQTAIFGELLFVGDVVELYNTERNSCLGMRAVARDECRSDGFVMGVAPLKFKNGISREWQIRKVRSYKDLKHGEKIDDIRVVLHNV